MGKSSALIQVRGITARDAQRFNAKVLRQDGCWLWTGCIDNGGYGDFRFGGRTVGAHVFAFCLSGRVIPDGFVIDHACHNADSNCPGGFACLHRRCVNPDHLEAVTQGTNLSRSRLVIPIDDRHKAITHCPQGHAYSGDNLYITKKGGRVCRACQRQRKRLWYSENHEHCKALHRASSARRRADHRDELNAYLRGWRARRKVQLAAIEAGGNI